ncbi:MAG: hypothetical protein ABJH98_17740 [Reichenbachiella sp.]|uniref:hypothetical protein n=1 Tax=Reichenbachiella sp. TaxID=2184521 RepID=UPI0032649C5E
MIRKNGKYDSPNGINKKIYMYGVDGQLFFMAVMSLLTVSFIVAIALGQFLYLFPLGIFSVVIMKRFFKPFEARYKLTKEDDVFYRKMEQSRQLKNYRDHKNLLR